MPNSILNLTLSKLCTRSQDESTNFWILCSKHDNASSEGIGLNSKKTHGTFAAYEIGASAIWGWEAVLVAMNSKSVEHER